MLFNLKVALASVCLLVLTVDALGASSTKNSTKKRREMLYEKRDLPLVKREVLAQRITVRSTPLGDP